MNNYRWLVPTLLSLLTACGDDTKEPVLDISGHWNIDHGFYDSCQVNVTFTDEQMLLSFYSLEEGACDPEAYGIDNNVLPVRIDSKQDSFAEDGALTTTLQVSAPDYRAEGTILLWQTEQGLAGSITSASDPFNLLEPLLEPTYELSYLPGQWVSKVLGKWSVPCEEVMLNHVGTELCEVIEFTSATSGKIKSFGSGPSTSSSGISSSSSGGSSRVFISNSSSDVGSSSSGVSSSGIGSSSGGFGEGRWEDTTFALRHLSQKGNSEFELDMTMLIKDVAVIPVTLSLSDEGFFITGPDESGEGFKRVALLRAD